MRALVSLALLLACDAEPHVWVTRGDALLVDVRVSIARDEDARRRGLRGLALERDEGLWIVFPATSEVCLVNDGVAIDVDAIFVIDGRVEGVARLPSDDPNPVCAEAGEVLEVHAGVADEVQVGDEVTWRE